MMGSDIYGPPCTSLGDCWACVNYLARKSILEDREILLSWFVIRPPGIARPVSAKEKLEEIVSVMDTGSARLSLTDKYPTVNIPFHCQAHDGPYFPAKRTWKPGGHGRICVQLFNSQMPEINPRCLPLHVSRGMGELLGSLGREVVPLGSHLTLAECIRLMAESDLFVGMDSGMSHLCHSVGTPMLLHKWRGKDMLDVYHPGKAFERFGSVEEARAAIGRMLPSTKSMPSC